MAQVKSKKLRYKMQLNTSGSDQVSVLRTNKQANKKLEKSCLASCVVVVLCTG